MNTGFACEEGSWRLEDSPGRELFSMFCTLMILILNVILIQNGIFKQEEARQTVRQ